MRFPCFPVVVVGLVLFALRVVAQSPNGNVNGLVLDPSNHLIVGAEIIAVNDVTSVQYITKTNNEGVYVLPDLPPGPYRIQVSKVGFKTIIRPDIILNVQDALSINFTLPVGAAMETVTVTGGAPLINIENASVSTVVDRQFAENLPMNGRSFQTLIELTPGVVLTRSNPTDSGQFSVNGQRADANYWMVDGVGANIGAGAAGTAGNGFGGASGSFSVLGGTNSLVSVDALQEFRIQTSTYAPEFGRTPGAQISIVTRSGTNQLHGTLFDYLRNDTFDANNWFNGYTNTPPLPKARERQNDFGGTISGPILKNRTFFFFSYEGLRLRLPETTLTTVPDLSARQTAVPAMQPYLDAFPRPNGPEQLENGNPTGAAAFNASYSNPATLDAYSLRIDHEATRKLSVFGRYNYSPSELVQRGFSSFALSVLEPAQITTQTLTVGSTWTISESKINDLRFNYSRTKATNYTSLDDFGDAIPLSSFPLPLPYTTKNGNFALGIFSLTNSVIDAGQNSLNLQRHINLVDNLVIQKASHTLKFGADFRRLSPMYQPAEYVQDVFFPDVASSTTGDLLFSNVRAIRSAELLFHNLGVFAQDTWRPSPRLTITYGLRWDVDFVPGSTNGVNFPAVTGLNFSDLSQLSLASAGAPPFRTTYGNVAPRLGLAYGFSGGPEWQTVLRGGVGLFYDLATSEVGNSISPYYPFGASNFSFGGTFPLSSTTATPPQITASSLATGTLYAFDPNLRLPYTLQWNFTLEQALGQQQTLAASYIGSVGRRLLQSFFVSSPNPSFGSVDLVANTATSDYDGLQIRFQRRLSQGLQALASYAWSHSIDTASAGSFAGNAANGFVPNAPNANRGPSDFDIRHAVSAGLTYDIPFPKGNALANAVFAHWSTQSVVLAHSAPPVNVDDGELSELLNNVNIAVRPDVVPGESFYLEGSQYPGGKALNLAAFVAPPTNADGQPIRQGDLGRNALRAFPAAQWDLALHRNFAIHEPVTLQFRAEFFNVLNHPNFGPPVSDISLPNFGLSNQLLSQSLNAGNLGGGGFDPLYQVGGPRSVQLALKLTF